MKTRVGLLPDGSGFHSQRTRLPVPGAGPVFLALLLSFALVGGAVAAPKLSAPAGPRGGTLRFVQEQAATLDPKEVSDSYSATITKQIHRGLLSYSTNLTPVPDVARSWIISRDGLTYTLDLNRGVRFHNGREVTSNDVVYTMERIFKPGTAPGVAGQFLSVIKGTKAYHQGTASRIEGVEALDRYTVRFTLSNPDATFLWALALNHAVIVPREAIERLGDAGFAKMPVGCGPFRIVSNTGGVIRLAAFEGYFRSRAMLDSLIFITPKDFSLADGVTTLLDGGCDIAEVPGFQREEVSSRPGFRIVSRRELTLSFISMNVKLKPLDNPHVRRAIALSVNRQKAIDVNPSGQVLSTGILPAGVPCYSPEVRVFPYDPEQARKELTLAGYPGGRGLPEIVFHTTKTTGARRLVDSTMVADWRAVGLPVRLEQNTWAELNQKLERFELPIFSLAWIADLPDPDSFLGSLFHSESESNFSRYVNPEADSLMVLARRTVDITRRQALYGRVEKIILKDAPIIPLYTSTTAFGLRQGVRGLELTPLGISCVDLAHIWIEGGDRAEIEP